MSYWGENRYAVTVYPDGYAVIDKADDNKVVFTTGTRERAWRVRGQYERRNVQERKSR